MIQITFQFSSVAAAAALLSKLDDSTPLPVISGDTVTVTPAPTAAPGKSAKQQAAPAPSPRTAEAAVAAAPAPSTEQQAPQQPTAAAAAASSAGEPVKYADLQAAVLKLHKLDPTAPVPIAQQLGFPTFKAMPDTKWAEALALVNEALAARGA